MNISSFGDCYICRGELKYHNQIKSDNTAEWGISGKLADGRIVKYCKECFVSLQKSLKIYSLRQKLLEKKTKRTSHRSHDVKEVKNRIDPIVSSVSHSFACKNYNTTWKNTSSSLDEVQAQHSMSNENHEVIEIPTFNLNEVNNS